MGGKKQKKRSHHVPTKRGKQRSSSRSKRERREVKREELEAIVDRAENALSREDHETLRAAIETLIFLTDELEAKGATIRRLRRLIFGSSTEKTSKVVGEQTDSDDEGDGASDDGTPTADESAQDGEKKKRKGHGRRPASEYEGAEKIAVPHESLKHGDRCPECLRGKVYRLDPALLVRVASMAPLSATVYERERLRCNLCGEVFTAKVPDGVGDKKYDETAAAMIGLLKYGTGMPFNRLERLEGSLGIPLPASTQWDVVERAAVPMMPAYEQLVLFAAAGDLLHNDDTVARILDLEPPSPDGPGPDRTGIFTSGIVSVGEGRRIALFFTGRKHAGENLEDLLAKRAAALSAPMQMCDGLDRNLPGELETILSNCLVHARRHFVEVVNSFPDEVKKVLDDLKTVYEVDDEAKKQGLDDEQRLRLHQERSGPVMDDLKAWLDKQVKDKLVEPNSGLGQAIAYMRKRWQPLTLFLREPGAALDNNIAERALKKAIMHRKNSLFFKTENGARVGDLYMSLIHTCELNGTNPFDYLVALQRNAADVEAHPEQWMPWNYRERLGQLAAS
jgi:hypothetical protein